MTRRIADGPVIHLALYKSEHGPRLHSGEALCGAGEQSRTEKWQLVIDGFKTVTCRNCIRMIEGAKKRTVAQMDVHAGEK